MKNENKKLDQRNYYLDFLRGLAAINIIIIHTAFWSGGSYVPVAVESLTLLFDVPFFFFLAGWSFYYTREPGKAYKNLFNMQMKYLFFLIIYSIILFLVNRSDFSFWNFVHWFFYIEPHATKILPVVMGSIWFMPIYVQVTMIFSIAIYFTQLKNNTNIVLIVSLLGFLYTELGQNFLFFDRYILFYGFLYTLGFLSVKYYLNANKLFVSLLVTITSILIVGKLLNKNIFDLQSLKFPPHFIYLLASLITILIAMYFKKSAKIKATNFLVHIGQNAIFYYFSQGIATSICYYYVSLFNFRWYLKFLVIILINILTTIAISESMSFLYNLVHKWLSYKMVALFKMSTKCSEK